MERTSSKWNKIVLPMLVGGVVGFLATRFGIKLGLDPLLAKVGIGAFALAAVGFIYALMGILVGIGVAMPGLGARFLNVSGREDLEDQRAMLTGSAVGCTALGAGTILFALAGPAGPVPGGLGLSAFIFSVILISAISILQWRLYDELWRMLYLESATYGWLLTAAAFVVWGGAAHTGHAVMPDAAGLLAMILGLFLLGCFVAIGRRGMLLQP